MGTKTEEQLMEDAYAIRSLALELAYHSGDKASHFGAGMSIVDILAVLYNGGVMKYDTANPRWEERDRFILSKGHGVIGYYAALMHSGFIPVEAIEKFEKDDSFLLGHPVKNLDYGIEFTTGSLGMGLSIGIGVAIAAKKRELNYKTYVLVGDGECDEGSVWEAIAFAAHRELDNLCLIIDRNRLQLGGNTEDIMRHGDLKSKLADFGWNAKEIDGHNLTEIAQTFSCLGENNKPLAIIANTVKGKGFSFAENNNAWHHAIMTAAQYESAKQELEERYHGI
jgi:transketolase